MTNPFKSIQAPATAPQPNSGANNYNDINALAALKKNPSSPQAIHAVAQQIDALFLQMMLKSMRDASAEMGEKDSNEMGMYQDMFDKQIALSMSQHSSLGLGAQLTRQMAAQAGGTAPGGGSAAVGAGGAARPGAASGAATGAIGAAGAAGAIGGKGAIGAMGATRGATAAPGDTAANEPADDQAPADAAQPIAAVGPGAANEAAAQSPAGFVSQVFPAIQRAAQALGVNPFALLAQAVLETGWGRRMARGPDGRPSHNMFGIKADDGWTGARAAAETVEFSGGVAVPRRTAFRAYGSIEDSVTDFARLLGSSPRYRDAVAGGADAQAYIHALGRSGYATDPKYADKISQILNSGTFRSAVRAHLRASEWLAAADTFRSGKV